MRTLQFKVTGQNLSKDGDFFRINRWYERVSVYGI